MKILIVGAGDVGLQLAKRLSGEHDVTIVDRDPAVIRKISSGLDAMTLEGDASSLQTLQQAKIEDADICAVMTHNDALNILVCLMAKTLGKATTIARVANPEFTAPDFPIARDRLGVDFMIHPEYEAARVIHQLLIQSVPGNATPVAEGRLMFTGMRVEPTSSFHNRSVGDCAKAMGGVPFNMVAVRRKEKFLIPRGNTILKSGDTVYFVCAPDDLKDMVKATGHDLGPVRNVMVLGGGEIAQTLASQSDCPYEVKVIEGDAERSHQMAEHLAGKAIVIHGEGTDLDLLVQEGITGMDAFIALTDSDETNIISNLVAKHLRVPRTMALLNNSAYLPVTSTIGLDAVISKELLCVNALQRFIRTRNDRTVTALPGLDVELAEIQVPEDCKAVQKPVSGLDFPQGALIAAVLRGEKTILTDGATRLMPGDTAVVVCLPEALPALRKWFA